MPSATPELRRRAHERAERLRLLSMARTVAGDDHGAYRAARAAVAAARRPGGHSEEGAALAVLAAAAANLRLHDISDAAVERATAVATASGDDAVLGAALAVQAVTHASAGRVAECIEAAVRAASALERVELPTVMTVNALVEAGRTLARFGELDSTRWMLDRAIAASAQVDAPLARSYALGAFPSVLVERALGAEAADPSAADALYAAAIPLAREAIAVADAAGDRQQALVSRADLALALAATGADDEAEALAERVVTDPEAWSASIARLAISRLLLARGDGDGARVAAESIPEGDPFVAAAAIHRQLAAAAEVSGDPSLAVAELKRALAATGKRLLAAEAGIGQIVDARRRALRAELEAAAARGREELLAAETRRHARDARIDALTGVANRRALDERFAAARTGGVALTVAMLDVDSFKAINDTWSHLVGDAVLRRVAAALRRASRAGDVVARYAGDEFAVVFVGAAASEAAAICERVRRAVAETGWGGIAPGLAVTISAGVASGEAGDDPLRVVEAADAALLVAKRTGRNQVVAA